MAIQRHVKRAGKLWIRIFPDKPITKKPLEVRMGSGKGAVEGWVAVVKPGRVLFEIAGVTEKEAREAFALASSKLPIDTRVPGARRPVMKAKELSERTTEDLTELKNQLRKDLFSSRMKNYVNQLDDTSVIRKTRKDIARIEQILHVRQSPKGN